MCCPCCVCVVDCAFATVLIKESYYYYYHYKQLYSRRHVELPLLFAMTFDNELADHKSAFKRFNGNLTTIFIRHGVSKRMGRSQF